MCMYVCIYTYIYIYIYIYIGESRRRGGPLRQLDRRQERRQPAVRHSGLLHDPHVPDLTGEPLV